MLTSTGGSLGYDGSTAGAGYKGDIQLSNLNALLDFHPLGPLFRVSGGVIFNNNKYEATATAEDHRGCVLRLDAVLRATGASARRYFTA